MMEIYRRGSQARAEIRWMLNMAEDNLRRGVDVWWNDPDKFDAYDRLVDGRSCLYKARMRLIDLTAGRRLKLEDVGGNSLTLKTAYPHLRELRRLTEDLAAVRFYLHAGRYFAALSILTYVLARVHFQVDVLRRMAFQKTDKN